MVTGNRRGLLLPATENLRSGGLWNTMRIMLNNLETEVFSGMESETLRKILNIGALCFCMLIFCGLIFCRVEAWAKEQETKVNLAALAMDEAILFSSPHGGRGMR